MESRLPPKASGFEKDELMLVKKKVQTFCEKYPYSSYPVGPENKEKRLAVGDEMLKVIADALQEDAEDLGNSEKFEERFMEHARFLTQGRGGFLNVAVKGQANFLTSFNAVTVGYQKMTVDQTEEMAQVFRDRYPSIRIQVDKEYVIPGIPKFAAVIHIERDDFLKKILLEMADKNRKLRSTPMRHRSPVMFLYRQTIDGQLECVGARIYEVPPIQDDEVAAPGAGVPQVETKEEAKVSARGAGVPQEEAKTVVSPAAAAAGDAGISVVSSSDAAPTEDQEKSTVVVPSPLAVTERPASGAGGSETLFSPSRKSNVAAPKDVATPRASL